MKIAIAGADVSGAYLYRLLNNQGHQVDLFDHDPGTRCGLSPCAWGTSRGFPELVKGSGLDPNKYVMHHFGYVVMDEYWIEADLTTVNKPRLVKDLRQGADIKDSLLNLTEHDRIIDATGVPRDFLPAMAILKEFQWMKPERNVIDKLRKNKSLGMNDAWVLRKNSRRMGMKVGMGEARVLLGHLR